MFHCQKLNVEQGRLDNIFEVFFKPTSVICMSKSSLVCQTLFALKVSPFVFHLMYQVFRRRNHYVPDKNNNL